MSIEKVLIDERMGIIRSVKRIDFNKNEKELFFTYSAESNKISNYLNWRPDYIGSGTSLDEERAYNSAIGELIERYCGNFIPENLLTSTIKDLKNQKILYPQEFMKFSKEQYCHKLFPFKVDNSNEKMEWVTGKCLTNQRDYLIPAKFVYLNYWMYRKSKMEIKQTPILLSGIAAGQSMSFAMKSAMLEIIERDTTMLWWLGNRSQIEISLESEDDLYKSIVMNLPVKTKIRWFLLPSDFSPYTVAAALIDDMNKIFSIGFSTRFSITEAMEKAASEAMQLRMVSLDMLNPSSSVWVNPDNKSYLGIKNYRKNRDYRKAFKNDWSDMLSLKHNLQYFLDDSTWDHAIRRLDNIDSVIKYSYINE